MTKLALALCLLVGCGIAGETSETPQTWDVWLNHGLTPSCHGYLSMETTSEGWWDCGGSEGTVRGRLFPDVALELESTPTPITIKGVVRDYDGAIIAKTPDGRPFVGYVE